jgi:hypothetical protein
MDGTKSALIKLLKRILGETVEQLPDIGLNSLLIYVRVAV